MCPSSRFHNSTNLFSSARRNTLEYIDLSGQRGFGYPQHCHVSHAHFEPGPIS